MTCIEVSANKTLLLLNHGNFVAQPSGTSENIILSKVLAEKEQILKLVKNWIKRLDNCGVVLLQKNDNTIVGWNANQLPQTIIWEKIPLRLLEILYNIFRCFNSFLHNFPKEFVRVFVPNDGEISFEK